MTRRQRFTAIMPVAAIDKNAASASSTAKAINYAETGICAKQEHPQERLGKYPDHTASLSASASLRCGERTR